MRKKNKFNKAKALLVLCSTMLLFTGCTNEKERVPSNQSEELTIESETKKQTETESEQESKVETDTETITESESLQSTEVIQSESILKESESEATSDKKTYLIVLDAGHSAAPAAGTEPIGPGAIEEKAKDSSGTSGYTSGLTEYELNLQVTLKLREELEKRGYEVVLTRESNDISISNIERASIANELDADAFIRVHANGAEDPSAKGAMTICQTATNPFVSSTYEASRALSDCILYHLAEKTGAYNRGVWETDTMTGINWSQVPVTIVEMGFMTNPEEDWNMSTEEYQEKIVLGIADGLSEYLQSQDTEQ